MGHYRLRHVKDRQHIDVVELAEGGFVGLHQRRIVVGPSSIVDHDVDAAQALAGRINRRLDLRALRHIAGDGHGGLANLFSDRPRAVPVHIHHRYFRTVLGEQFCHGKTEPRSGPRDQRAFSLQSHRPFPLPVIVDNGFYG